MGEHSCTILAALVRLTDPSHRLTRLRELVEEPIRHHAPKLAREQVGMERSFERPSARLEDRSHLGCARAIIGRFRKFGRSLCKQRA